jgi:hypothetical protein
MKKVLIHAKTSGIMAGNGLVSYAGIQFLSGEIKDAVFKTAALFLFMTVMGIVSKLVLDKVGPKPS